MKDYLRERFLVLAEEIFGKGKVHIYIRYSSPTNDNFWREDNYLWDRMLKDRESGNYQERIEPYHDLNLSINLNKYIEESCTINEIPNELYYQLYEKLEQEFEKALSCWTIYYQPRTYVSEDKLARLAFEIGLVPFKYDGDFYIAIGHYGKDFGPLLDYYQFKVEGTIPSKSILIGDPQHSRDIIGEKAYEEFEKEWMSKRRYRICIEEI